MMKILEMNVEWIKSELNEAKFLSCQLHPRKAKLKRHSTSDLNRFPCYSDFSDKK